MQSYLGLLRQVVHEGRPYQTGATLQSDGRKPSALGLFAPQFRHDLGRDGFPAVTTKKLYWSSVVRELLWFLRGDTNIATLGCGIWNGWADADGECGPIYGCGWRRWPFAEVADPDVASARAAAFDGVTAEVGAFDQIGRVLEGLREVRRDPHARVRRRLVVSAWNAPYVEAMGLPPCHTAFQFLPNGDRLNLHCFWRSIDAFLGMPFNIASYALLLSLVAAVTGFAPGEMVASITDLHVYDNQLDQVVAQLKREPYPAPTLAIDRAVRELAPDLTVAQCRLITPQMFTLVDYQCHGPLPCEVAV